MVYHLQWLLYFSVINGFMLDISFTRMSMIGIWVVLLSVAMQCGGKQSVIGTFRPFPYCTHLMVYLQQESLKSARHFANVLLYDVCMRFVVRTSQTNCSQSQ